MDRLRCWRLRLATLALFFSLGCFYAPAQEPASLQIEFFEKSVRPLLVARCLECHSSETEINGGLSLDSKSDWIKGGDSGQAIDLEDWQKSLFWQAIEYRNPKLQMPPDSKLSEQEREIFRRWLSQGAVDPREARGRDVETKKATALSVVDAQKHWAYRPVQVPSMPITAATNGNAIDAFLAVSHASAGIHASELAASDVLLQRLYVDLHGLRSTASSRSQDRVHSSTEAVRSELEYSELVDSLLASPRFGERFARHWMDAVRFAESLTLRGFVLPDAWRYRNYLIQSFNDDKPFSDLVQEQVAGDLMQSDSLAEKQSQLVATTVLALGDTNLEEQDKKQLEMDYVDEQLEMIGKVFLAQTIGCARCHDHKFDPIPTRDYYALAGILKSSIAMEHSNVSKWISLPLPQDTATEAKYSEKQTRLEQIKKQIDSLKKAIQSGTPSSTVVRAEELEGIVVDDKKAKRVGDWTDSNSIQAYVGDGYLHDKNERKGEKSVTFEPMELKPGSYRVRLAYAHGDNRAKSAMIRIFSAEGEDVVRVNQTQKPADDGLWQTLGTYRFEQGGQAFVIVSNEQSDGHVIADAVQFLPESTKQLTPVIEVAKAESQSVESLRNDLKQLESEQKFLQSELDSRPAVIALRPAESPSDIAVHIRGNVHQQGAKVPRGFLTCLSSMEGITIDAKSNGRLEFAKWLASDQNPLTARVYVNRVWSWLMGDGIVRTIDNFGTTGEEPVSAELLDWLTHQFIQHGWSTKWLVREIVHSDAYKRSSRGAKEATEVDPDNRLFARSFVRRLDAESFRDSLLELSGELELSGQIQSTIPQKTKEDYAYQHTVRYRSVYGPWFRNSLPELYLELDGANPSFPIAKRNRSTIAPQSLAILNSQWIAERTLQFGSRLALMADCTQEQKIGECFMAVLNRGPTSRELQWAKSTLASSDFQTMPEAKRWGALTHQLVASIDFRYVE